MNTHSLLVDLLQRIRCKPGWEFRLVEEGGFNRLVIAVEGLNSDHPDDEVPIVVRHFFPVPETTWNLPTWRRWVFECCRRVENHELGEWFRDGEEQPFRPLHGPGEDPYTVHEFRPEIDARTLQNGSVREKR